MPKKIFLGIALFMLSLAFFNMVAAAEVELIAEPLETETSEPVLIAEPAVEELDYQAQLTQTCSLRKCLIPIPTLVKPDHDNYAGHHSIYLTGLTWNDTEIDIYVDDQYWGKATVINDPDSDTANFFFLIDSSLLAGKHDWQVIAWSQNRRDRSFVSTEKVFTIVDYFSAPVLSNLAQDIDGDYWLAGTVSESVAISIYVDGVFQGEVLTDGHFNFRVGHLSPGLHTFYAIAQTDTGQISQRSNILSQTVITPEIVAEEIEEPIESAGEEDLMVETERETGADISAISEEIQPETEIIVDSEEVEGEVVIIKEEPDQIVVDTEESSIEDLESDTSMVEELQPASPDEQTSELITEDLDLLARQERNRKLGMWLLGILAATVLFSAVFSKPKQAQKSATPDKDSNSQQGDLFKD